MRNLQLRKSDPVSSIHRSKSTITKDSFRPLDAALVEDSAVIGPLTELSEVSDDNLCGEITENLTPLENPADQTSSDTDASSLSSSSVMISEKHVIHYGRDQDQDPKGAEDDDSIELEMVMKDLKEAWAEVRRSNGLGHSKKLLNLLKASIMEDLTGGQHDEKTWLAKLSSREVLVPLTFMMVIFLVFVLGLLSSEANGLPPS